MVSLTYPVWLLVPDITADLKMGLRIEKRKSFKFPAQFRYSVKAIQSGKFPLKVEMYGKFGEMRKLAEFQIFRCEEHQPQYSVAAH